MSTTLKMLIEQAKTHYTAMEAKRPTIPYFSQLMTSLAPGSKLWVLEQLLAQYDAEPEAKHVYKNRNPLHTPDQVVAEIINLNLTKGVIDPNEVTPMKVSLSFPNEVSGMKTILGILDNCAQAELGDLAIARARQNIQGLREDYKAKLGHVDTELDFLTDANQLLDTIADNRLQAAEKQRKDHDALLENHAADLLRLQQKHERDLDEASAYVLQEITTLGKDADYEIDKYEDVLTGQTEQYQKTLATLKAQHKQAVASLEFLIEEKSRKLVDQHSEHSDLLLHYENLAIELAGAKSKIEEASRVNDGLAEGLTKAAAKHREHLKEITGLYDQVDALKSSLAEAQSKLQETTKDRDQLAPQVTDLLDLVGSKDNELNDLHAQLLAAQEQLSEKDAALITNDEEFAVKLKKAVADKEKAVLDKVRRELDDSKQVLIRTQKISGQSQEQNQLNLATIAKQNETIRQLQAAIDSLQAQVDELSLAEHQDKRESKPVTKAKATAGDDLKPGLTQSSQLLFNGNAGGNGKQRLSDAEKKKRSNTKQVAPLTTYRP